MSDDLKLPKGWSQVNTELTMEKLEKWYDETYSTKPRSIEKLLMQYGSNLTKEEFEELKAKYVKDEEE